jgi:hypothetical protein
MIGHVTCAGSQILPEKMSAASVDFRQWQMDIAYNAPDQVETQVEPSAQPY